MAKDATELIRLKASRYPNVDEGTACTQSSFKAGKKSFLFIGQQGGRHKAMFKLDKSRAEAEKLAIKEPDNYQVGSSVWVTVRFSDDSPLPKKLWEKWLDESYELTVEGSPATRSKTKKSAKLKTTKKKAVKKKTKKKAAKKKVKKKK